MTLLKTQHTFRPYKGGGGPQKDQVTENNLFLKEKLESLGVICKDDTDFMKGLIGIEQTLIKIKHPTKRNVIYVGYDRWGFVIDQYPEDVDVDQMGVEDTIDLIKKWYFN